MPVLEAMAQGKPCLVSDHGALPERILDTVNGFVLPLDGWAWADAIHWLRWQLGRAEGMGMAALQMARGYSWEASAKRLLKVMEGL